VARYLLARANCTVGTVVPRITRHPPLAAEYGKINTNSNKKKAERKLNNSLVIKYENSRVPNKL